jgi:glycosyltransferase involved in cell wall biosynthesis
MKKICFVTAAPLTLRAFMRNHLLRLSETYEVSAVADFKPDELETDWLPGVQLAAIPISRQIRPAADLRALIALYRHFRSGRFDVVHSVTPKAGLLAMTAARFAGIPHRIHCFTGQVWATRHGLGRTLLKGADRLIAANASHVLTDSHSQRDFLEDEGVIRKGRADVLGQGSISGVDLERFHPDDATRARIRDGLGIPHQACLLLFVGRLNPDKGVLDLARAFAQLAHNNGTVWLAMAGPDEARVGAQFEELCGEAINHVRRIDYTPAPEHYMAAADVFVLPSYREGFGSVVIEAAACGLPAVASRIYGLTDAVEEGSTGLLHPPGDVEAMHDHLQLLCADETHRRLMGEKARERAISNFSMESVTADLLDYYETILGPQTPL